MSVYSMDSLDDDNEISSGNQDSICENAGAHNLESNQITTDLSSNLEFRLQPITPLYTLKQDTGSNETTLSTGTNKDTGTADSRNAIIAKRRLADASKRRRPAFSRKGKRDVTDRLQRNSTESFKQDEDCSNKSASIKTSKHFSKTVPTKRSCYFKDKLKPEKKLGNMLAPKIHQARKPGSNLELYHRRFSRPPHNARSPEGSTLSVSGDSEQGQLIDDDIHSFATPRDDQSELSFYRRIIRGSVEPLASAARTNEAVLPRTLQDTNTTSTCSIRVSHDKSDDKSKSLNYKPYTIEEYKTLPIPKLDRSLGPDKVEMQAKGEWLMRRRSYGNSVSARNRQRILQQADRLKSEDAVAEKCFLPPLKDKEADAKAQVTSTSSTLSETQDTMRNDTSDIGNGRHSKKNRNVCQISTTRKTKKFERTSSFCSLLSSYDIIQDSYLESLRQRHDYEKQMVDRITKKTVRH